MKKINGDTAEAFLTFIKLILVIFITPRYYIHLVDIFFNLIGHSVIGVHNYTNLYRNAIRLK